MWSFRVVMCFLFACYVIPAVGDWNDPRIRPFTDAELKALPPYCAPRLLRTPGQYEHWREILGQDYDHTHHYCEGLGYLNRSYRARSQQESKDLLRQAEIGIGYLIHQAQPTYSLMPEAHLNLGLVLSLLGNNGGAIKELNKALELNPNLLRAYILASDIYIEMKQKNEALTMISEGLRHVPDSNVLRRMYKEQGGKLPYPEPINRSAETRTLPGQARGEGETAKRESEPQDPAQRAAGTSAPDATASGGRSDAETPATPKIGSPTNPWCRFCPDPAQ
jgi:tetratricopeptide (TPR) repeat protein